MKIEERKVTVREVTEGYFNDAEEGVVGYDGCWIFGPNISGNLSTRTLSATR